MREEYDDDIEDDYEDDDDEILADGEARRISISMLDSTQRAIAENFDTANHRPGWRVPERVRDQDGVIADAYGEYVKYLQTAHRTGYSAQPARSIGPVKAIADATAAAEQARLERDQWMVEAHKERR
jgi:hypothetical protein